MTRREVLELYEETKNVSELAEKLCNSMLPEGYEDHENSDTIKELHDFMIVVRKRIYKLIQDKKQRKFRHCSSDLDTTLISNSQSTVFAARPPLTLQDQFDFSQSSTDTMDSDGLAGAVQSTQDPSMIPAPVKDLPVDRPSLSLSQDSIPATGSIVPLRQATLPEKEID